MDTIMYLIGYDSDFKKYCKTGWGCGYVGIPENHPVIKLYTDRIAKEQEEEDSYVDRYFHELDFNQEITYTEWKTLNGIRYLIIGFDTAHIYNNPTTHTHEWVLIETVAMKNLIDNYKG